MGDDLAGFSFNTAVAALMELRNAILDAQRSAAVSRFAWEEAVTNLLLLLAPIAPHITEELWAKRGFRYSIHQEAWPAWDEEIAREDTITLIVQVNGKVRAKIEVAPDISNAEAQQVALSAETVQSWLAGKTPRKVVVVPGKLVNIVL